VYVLPFFPVKVSVTVLAGTATTAVYVLPSEAVKVSVWETLTGE